MVKFIIAFISFLVFLGYMFPLAYVIGDSMEPTYKEGDILICIRKIPFQKNFFSLGDVYVYIPPVGEDVHKYVIKRLHEKKGKGCYFLGDNHTASFDSRSYGFVSDNRVVCKKLFRIHKEV